MTAPLMLHVEPRKPKRRKWLYRVLWGLLAVVTAAGTFWWWQYHAALKERDALIVELRARGEPVFWNELADKLLMDRSADTGADLFMRALWAMGGELNRAGPRVPTVKLEDDLKDQRFVPAVRPAVQQELALAEPALALLEEAVKRPPGLLTTALRTDDPAAILLPHIQDGRNLVRLLHWVANDALGRGDAKRAYHAVWLALASAEQLAAEPFLIAQLVRLAMRGAACETLQMCLAHAPPPEEEFRAIDRALAAVDDGFGANGAWLSERALWMTVLEEPRRFREFAVNSGLRFGGAGNDFERFMRDRWGEVVASPLGRPVMLRTQAAYLRLSERLANLSDRPRTDPREREAAFEEFEREAPLHKFGFDLGDWGLRSVSVFDQSSEKAHRRNVLARLTLRLRRHFDRHGKFPEKLDELCDADMPRVRTDWFQDKPIGYASTNAGFRLEVPEELLSKADRERKKASPDDVKDLMIAVELKELPKQAPR